MGISRPFFPTADKCFLLYFLCSFAFHAALLDVTSEVRIVEFNSHGILFQKFFQTAFKEFLHINLLFTFVFMALTKRLKSFSR